MTSRFGFHAAAAVLVALAALGGKASAQLIPVTLLDDNFDSYADTAAFSDVWLPVTDANGAHPSGVVSTAQAVSLTNSVMIAAERDSTQSPAGSNANAMRNERAFEESGNISTTNVIEWSFDFYDALVGGAGGAPRRHFSNLQDGTAATATNQLIAMGTNNNQSAANSGGNFYMGRILGYTPFTTADPDGGPAETTAAAGSFFKLNDFPNAPLRSLGWHNFRVRISSDDDVSTDYEFFVDNILAEKVSNVGTVRRSYDVIRLGAGLTNTGTEAFFDNVKVVLNPEIIIPPVADADFDADGDIDGADFLTWQQGVGIDDGSATLASGDANDDGNVDGLDLEVWKLQFEQAPEGGVSAVPEPATLALAGLALIGGVAAVRRRR